MLACYWNESSVKKQLPLPLGFKQRRDRDSLTFNVFDRRWAETLFHSSELLYSVFFCLSMWLSLLVVETVLKGISGKWSHCWLPARASHVNQCWRCKPRPVTVMWPMYIQSILGSIIITERNKWATWDNTRGFLPIYSIKILEGSKY